MPFAPPNWNPSQGERRAFGLMLAAGMPVSGVVWFLLVRGLTGEWRWMVPVIITGVGGALGLSLALFPAIAWPFYCAWYFLVQCIEWVVTSTLLTLMYFGVVTPYALVTRLVRRKAIQKRPRPDLKTYWQAAEKPADHRRYFRQF